MGGASWRPTEFRRENLFDSKNKNKMTLRRKQERTENCWTQRRKMGQRVKCFPNKHELIPSSPRKLGVMVHSCTPNTSEVDRQIGPWGSGARQPA